jgi:hypothetical protein
VKDHAIALIRIAPIRYETGAISQTEESRNFREEMDLRDEVSGSEGTLRLDHRLRAGF